MTKLFFAFWAGAFRTALVCAPLLSPPSSGTGPAPAKKQASIAGRGRALRQSLCALLWACTIVHASAAAMTRQEIEATLASAMTQVVNQYVDPLDSRVLVVNGLSALKALPGAEDPSRKAAIDQAVLTGHQTEGMTPQIRILTGEILRFADGTPREMALDLRGNAGGLLDAAELVAGMVLPEGSEIGSLRGRTPDNARTLRARAPLVQQGVPVVVLVDHRTGAGAEIVAAALQDHGRALLIGTATLGAGTIQTVRSLPGNQGALVITTARVHRADGARLDSVGVAPDMLLDKTGRRVTLRTDIAADFNSALAQKVRTAVASAPDGADTALLAALTALTAATTGD